MKPPEPISAASSAELPSGPIMSAARGLPAGTRLDEFEVAEIIGEGSATIVYAATHRVGAAWVAIAEYMPAQIAQRNVAGGVRPTTSADADVFAKGLKAFIEKRAAKFEGR